MKHYLLFYPGHVVEEVEVKGGFAWVAHVGHPLPHTPDLLFGVFYLLLIFARYLSLPEFQDHLCK